MKILKLQTENFMNIRMVKIDLDGKPLIISGDNAQGKSSLRNSIFSMLEGLKVTKPIRDGETQAKSRLEVGDETGTKFIIEEVITENGERFKVTAPTTDGGTLSYDSPRKFLKQFLSFISVDPGVLADLLRSDKKEDKRKALDLLIDLLSKHGNNGDVRAGLEHFASEKQKLKDARSKAIQEAEYIEKTLQKITPDESVFNDVPDALIDSAELTKKLSEYEVKVNRYDEYVQEETQIVGELKGLDDRIDQVRRELESLQKVKEATIARLNDLNQNVPQKPNPEEYTAIQESIKTITERNQKISQKKQFYSNKKEGELRRELASKLLKGMNEVDELKQKALASLPMPIPGLSIGEDEILFNSLPLSNESESSLIRIATSILMAMNPKLKTIILRNGNAFTLKNLNQYIEWVNESGYQLITEYCDDSGEIGLFIENGEVKQKQAVA